MRTQKCEHSSLAVDADKIVHTEAASIQADAA